MLSQPRVLFLLAGGINTLFGYMIGVSVYAVIGDRLNIIWIGMISSYLSITFSFLTHKIFVFKTKGMWLFEYLKAFVVYGGIAIIGVFFLWFFVEIMNISIWISQALVSCLGILISYAGHSQFTFRRREN
jgi:putative flippase GtrA